MGFHPVTDQLPVCDLTPNSLGVEVRIKPAIEGDDVAFYGCRLGEVPQFYRYGARLPGVKRWAYVPSYNPGTVWLERDTRMGQRFVRIVVDARDAAVPHIDPELARAGTSISHRSIRAGKIGLVAVDHHGVIPTKPSVTWADPKRFYGQSGGYAPHNL